MTTKPDACPRCGSPRIAEILYGLVRPDEELTRELEAKRVVLGGCFVEKGNPKWLCVDCSERLGASAEWFKEAQAREKRANKAAEAETAESEDRRRRGCGTRGDCPNCGFSYAFDGKACSHCNFGHS